MFVPMVTDGEPAPAGVEPGGARAEGKWFAVDRRANVLVAGGRIPVGSASPVEALTVHLLGLDDGLPVYAVEAAGGIAAPDGAEWVGLRQLYGSVPESDWGLAGRAAQIVSWDRDHRFCGRCGQPTEHHRQERARICSTCELLAFPRLSPAVIVLVEREDGRALLAWGRQFPGRFYSTLAGFVEPGESLEQAVEREVKEEVGIDVAGIRYFGSQPWPFPHSMMVGFTASYAGGRIEAQESEIVEAGWYRHDELPPVPRGGMSIAGWLIEDWVKRRSGS
jgi:NAD+ diphosphatase